MRVFTSLFIALAFVVAVPFANAQTVEQLQAQIQQLLQQVAALQAAINNAAQSGTNTTPGVGNPSTAQACLNIARNLGPGSEGSEVTKLQQFLAQDPTIYPEGLVTGYYGSLTVAAVQRWQKRYDVVSSGSPETTGYGSVGPLTRRALAGCGDVLPSQFGGFMRVNPVSGDAPLTVSVTATINTARSCDLARYTLDFGDGTAPLTLTVPAQSCRELEQVLTHTYTQPGTYTITLGIGSHRSTVDVRVGGTGSTNNNNNNNQNPSCGVAPTQPPAASCVGVWERVYDNNSCHIQWKCSGIQPLSVSPNSGTAPLTATASFDIRAGDPYEVDWGDGTSKTAAGTFTSLQSLSYDSVVLPSTSRVNVQHTYNKTGTFKVMLKRGSYEKEGNQWVWRVRQYEGTVTVTGTNVNDELIATSIEGTAPFTAAFTANINGAGVCSAGSYTVDFGDGSSRSELTYPANSCTSRTYNITHIYTQPGTYSARLYKGTIAEVSSGSASLVNTETITVTGGSGAASGPFTISAGVDENPRKIRVTFTLPSAEACNSYRLSWGDSSSAIEHDAGDTTGVTCTQSVIEKQFTHTYPNLSNDKTYSVQLWRGAGSLSDIYSSQNPQNNRETASVTILD